MSKISAINVGEIKEGDTSGISALILLINSKINERRNKIEQLPQNKVDQLRSELIDGIKNYLGLTREKVKATLSEVDIMTVINGIIDKYLDLSEDIKTDISETVSEVSSDDMELISEISEALKDYPLLLKLIMKLFHDNDHIVDIVKYLRLSQTKQRVLDELKLLGSIRPLTREVFLTKINEELDPDRIGTIEDDREFNEDEDGVSRMSVLRQSLVDSHPLLYSIGGESTPEKLIALRKHSDRLNLEIKPVLHALLQRIAGPADIDGFPRVSTRAKNASAMLEKIERIRQGNPVSLRPPRPEYHLADMPDMIGGRITVPNTNQLLSVMQRLEDHFGKENIFQKENFYLSTKKERPFRVITYTVRIIVQIDGIPCEIQINTLRSSLAADIEHNTVYKNYHPDLSDADRKRAVELQMAAAISDHEDLKKKG